MRRSSSATTRSGLIAIGKQPPHAFAPNDVNLIGTVAASLSVALQNVQSFEAERQRAAELAIINAVQQALAGELTMQGVYDAVGDKLRDIFPGSGVSAFESGTQRPKVGCIPTCITTVGASRSPAIAGRQGLRPDRHAYRQDAADQRGFQAEAARVGSASMSSMSPGATPTDRS